MNRSKMAYYSGDNIDKVIFSTQMTITASGTYTIPQSTTKIGAQLAYPLAITSTDGGATWFEYASVSCNPDGSVTVPSAGARLVRLCLLALDTPTAKMTDVPSQSGKTALASSDKKSNPSKYRQIVTSAYGVQPGLSPGAPITTPHGLGYVPDLLIWWTDGFNTTTSISPIGSNSNRNAGVAVDATNIYVLRFFATTKYYYRGYSPT